MYLGIGKQKGLKTLKHTRKIYTRIFNDCLLILNQYVRYRRDYATATPKKPAVLSTKHCINLSIEAVLKDFEIESKSCTQTEI